eukprot:362942-Chlamydomonas_euryale.AAC.14
MGNSDWKLEEVNASHHVSTLWHPLNFQMRSCCEAAWVRGCALRLRSTLQRTCCSRVVHSPARARLRFPAHAP